MNKASKIFRAKWRNYVPKNKGEKIKLEKARRYFHNTHVPLRSIKVGTMALVEWLRQPSWSALKWSLRNLCIGFYTFIKGQIFRILQRLDF